jgi:hypothetical protein
MSFRVSWQDWRAHRPDDAKPPVHHEDYPDIEQARCRKAELQRDGVVACIIPTPAPRAKRSGEAADRWRGSTSTQPSLVE